ncbi:response regulator [Atopobiaceae bacterium 24-176]
MGAASGTRAPVVLVVDDDPAIVGLVGALVEGDGLGFVGAGSGEEALRAVAAGPVGLVLLDVMMPGMDGVLPACGLGVARFW